MSWLDFERQHVWHPYAGLPAAVAPLPVASASGVYLKLEDGSHLIDGMSSWWAAIHGYNHPRLNSAIYGQLKHMSHVMFGGLTHRSAVELADRLIELTPQPLEKIFFSDSGSVSVEVALKMAAQYWSCQGKRQKQQFVALRHGYHGDTTGAMSVSDPENGMHKLFAKMLQKQYIVEAPKSRPGEDFDAADIGPMARLLELHTHEIAAVIVEPLVQGAGGMRFYHPGYLKALREVCDRTGVLLIFDEIATGFGRTGTLFACEQADVSPDIMCIGKALTAGYMTLAATLTNTEIATVISNNEPGVFMHGPTYMANPLACAVANENIELLQRGAWQKQVQKINQQLTNELEPATGGNGVADVRVFGAIGVIEMQESVDMSGVTDVLLDNGVWLRPFGKLIYTMPPYIIEPDELTRVTHTMCELAAQSKKAGNVQQASTT